MANKSVETFDKDSIIGYLETKSEFMSNYIKEHYDSEFLMIYKYMTHSDLVNKGKRNGNKETLEKNFLYYLSNEEMNQLEKEQEKPFESAKQSNIGVPTIFFSSLGIDQLERRQGQQSTTHNHIKINDYANVYLVNETLTYFNSYYTRKVLDKLNKRPNWYDLDYDVELRDGDITDIQLTHAIHGLGTSDDKEFAKLRLNIFKNDIIIFLIESRPNFQKNLFIMVEKNPIFFNIIGETNNSWQRFAEKQKKIEEYNLKNKTIIDIENEEKTRKQQSKWRTMLAEEMMNYSTKEGEVFCPFTYISCNFEELGPLFVASHIKDYASCENAGEAFDINNGLLLSSNADALFDKHLITINEDKELEFSFLLKNDHQLISKLLLSAPIFKMVLNDERMKYLKHHREKFKNLEELRKKK